MVDKELQFIKEHAPCYLYDISQVNKRCQKLEEAFPDFYFLYSIKANPFEPIIKNILGQGFGADAASANEVELAVKNGADKNNIYYSSPGKTEAAIERCIDQCILIADSINEIYKINKIAKVQNRQVEIGIRINPDFTMELETGTASKFGIDIQQLKDADSILKDCQNIRVTGIHIHIKSQELNYKRLARYYLKCFETIKSLDNLLQLDVKFINFGSGIGTIYDNIHDQAVDLESLSEMIHIIVKENQRTWNARLMIETGRYLVCNAGTYYTPIVDVKISQGTKFLIVENGLNSFLRPAVANMTAHISPDNEISGMEPLYTSSHAFQFSILNNEMPKEPVTVAGSLCTGLDILGRDLMLGCADMGDILSVSNAGSYAYTLSPLLFSSHNLSGQYCIYEDGEIK